MIANHDIAPSRRVAVASLRDPHARQKEFISSTAPRKIIRAGRRSGKTTGVAILCIQQFLAGGRILYTAPTQEQVSRFWGEVCESLYDCIAAGAYKKNESDKTITKLRSDQRIKAKTAWNADTLRGDYADILIFDEWQLCDENAWEHVGAPMLLDNDGDAIFIYTPPSMQSRSTTKARDPRHASKMFSAAQTDTTGRWRAWTFPSHENPYINRNALAELSMDMSAVAYRQEILAEDVEDVPGALWKHDWIEQTRVQAPPPDLDRIVVGVDPPGGATECGIIVAGIGLCHCRGIAESHGYVLADVSVKASPHEWGAKVVAAYHEYSADRILGESNYGGDMVKSTILTIDPDIAYHAVRATRGKAVRAEPIASRHERGMIHFVGSFDALEDELCTWIAGRSSSSPNRLDAFVWAMTDLAHEGWSVWGGRDADEHTKKTDISGTIAEHGVFWPSS